MDSVDIDGMNAELTNLGPGCSVPKPATPRAEEEIMSGWSSDVDTPLVSIVCHSFNHINFIKDALNGFLMQATSFPFEIVVHDDASQDGTKEVIQQYAINYPNIIRPIFQVKNIYSRGERPPMYSFPAAKGKYIALCEGDDYWIDEEKLQKQVSFLEANSDYALCYTDSMPFKNQVVIDFDFGGARRDLASVELKKAPSIFTLTVCFRNVLDVPPEWGLVKYGDKFIWSRLGFFGKGKYLDDIKPSMYRVHDGGLHSLSSRKKRHLMNFFTYSAMASYYERIGEDYLFAFFLKKAKGQVYNLDSLNPKFIPLVALLSFFYASAVKIFKKMKRAFVNFRKGL